MPIEVSFGSAQSRLQRGTRWLRAVIAPLALVVGWFSMGAPTHADRLYDPIGADLARGGFVAISGQGDRVESSDAFAWDGVGRAHLGDSDGTGWREAPALPSGHRYGAFSADGGIIAVGSADNIVRVHSIPEAPPASTTTTSSTTTSTTTATPPTTSVAPLVPSVEFQRVGAPIVGAQPFDQTDGPSDRTGTAVALSATGHRIAIGSPSFPGIRRPGYVRVLEWNGAWEQVGEMLVGRLGQSVPGETVGDMFGFALAMSASGDRVAIGAPGLGKDSAARVFDWTGSAWRQVGNDVVFGDSWEFGVAGSALALSPDGNRLAVGSLTHWNVGHVRVFDWDETRWVQAGSTLSGDRPGGRFGESVALSSDGRRLAVGSPLDDHPGFVKVFTWDAADWVPTGETLSGNLARAADGTNRSGGFGNSVALSADGNRLVVGAPHGGAWVDLQRNVIDTSVDREFCVHNPCVLLGQVSTYVWDGSRWIPQGDALRAAQSFGWSVALSADGTRVAAGSPYADPATFGGATLGGSAHVYDWDSSAWVWLGNRTGLQESQLGLSIALSADGGRMAIGAPGDGHVVDGQVELWDIVPIATTTVPTPSGTLPATGAQPTGAGYAALAMVAGVALLTVARFRIKR